MILDSGLLFWATLNAVANPGCSSDPPPRP